MTTTQYLQLLGLCELVKHQVAALRATERAIAELLDVEADDPANPYFGHVSDALHEPEPAAYLIGRYGLEVPRLVQESETREGSDA